MVNLLAIETSGVRCSVALRLDGNRFSQSEHVSRRHNEVLLPMLTALRQRASLGAADFGRVLDGVAFGCGPGSFTGVRIAAAAAQAIALASDAVVLRVSSSAAMALKAIHLDPATPGVLTFIRSRRDLHYVAAYRAVNGSPVPVRDDRLFQRSPEHDWLVDVRGWPAVGATPPWWSEPVMPIDGDAEQVLTLAESMFAEGEGVDPALGLPDYLEGDSPWRKGA